jgi:hypothetical protein
MPRSRGSMSPSPPRASTVYVPHFCECTAGCEVPTAYREHYCELHSEESQVLELSVLFDDGCPRCGLLAPKGSHLHQCVKRRRRSKGRLRSRHDVTHRDTVSTWTVVRRSGVC